MTDIDGTCEYVLDPDDPETWNGERGDDCYLDEENLNEDGVWNCPHDAKEGENYCLIHLDTTLKSGEETTNYLYNLVNKTRDFDNPDRKRRFKQFFGGKFGNINMSDEVFEDSGDFPIDLKHSTVQGELICLNVTTESALDWRGSRFYGNLAFNGSNINGNLNLRKTYISGKVALDGVKIQEDAGFSGATISGEISITDATIGNDLDFAGGTYKNDIKFSAGVEITNGPIFIESEVRGWISIEGTTSKEGCSFMNSNFRSPLYISNFNIESGSALFAHSNFKGLYFNASTPEGPDTSMNTFKYSNFDCRFDFEGITIKDGGNFNNTQFEGVLFNGSHIYNTKFKSSNLSNSDFSDSTIRHSNFKKANLSDVDFSNSEIEYSNLEQSVMNRADLTGTTFHNVAIFSSLIGDSHINERTEFDERCIYESDEHDITNEEVTPVERLTKAAGQYRLIEQLARMNSFPDMVSHNFKRRKEIHREKYKLEERWGRWLGATASKWFLGYGESPWRVITTGLLTILMFGLLYPLVGGLQPVDGSAITISRTIDNPILLAQSIYYSTLTFTTLGMGDFLPIGMGKVLTTLETSIGAIIIALLVFVFGRRAAR